MKNLMMPLAIALLSILASATTYSQNQTTVYFSTRFAETPASGRGSYIVDSTAPCVPIPIFGIGYVIESAVSNSPGVCYVTPGSINSTVVNSLPPGVQITDFVEIANAPQLQLIIGDTDSDGTYLECANFPGVDAMHILAPAVGRPNNIHEMFISTFRSTSGNCGHAVGTGGYTATGIEPADLVLLQKAANAYPSPSTPRPPVFLIRRAHIEALLGLAAPFPAMDVNAFARDESNGDLYVSFNAMITGANVITSPGTAAITTNILAGDILRIPGTAYTPSGVYGVVTAPVAGMVERVYTAINVNSIVLTAGGSVTTSAVFNVYSLSLDPQNTALTVTPAGFTVPGLLFTVDNAGGTVPGLQNLSASAIYSNQGSGSFANMNGVVMNQPSAIGASNTSFSNGFYSGPLDAMSVVVHVHRGCPTRSAPGCHQGRRRRWPHRWSP
jgi:hypothetical protein